MLWTVQWDHEMSENYWIFHMNLILSDRIKLFSFFYLLSDMTVCYATFVHTIFCSDITVLLEVCLMLLFLIKKVPSFLSRYFLCKSILLWIVYKVYSHVVSIYEYRSLFEIILWLKMDMGGGGGVYFFIKRKKILEQIFNDWRMTFDGFHNEIYDQVLLLVWQVI